MAVASKAPVRILGVASVAEVSTMLLRGQRLLSELDRGRQVDAHDGQLAGHRSSGVHVEIEVIAPGVRRAGAIEAELTGPGFVLW